MGEADEKPSETKVKRDKSGRFKASTPPTQSIKTQAEVKGIPEVMNIEKTDDPENLIDVKIHNPLEKITQILEDIKNKQSTTFSMRFTIPLIALPVFFFLVFQMGRAQTACTPVFASKVGTFVSVPVMAPKSDPGFIQSLFSFLPKIPHINPPSELEERLQSVLFTPNESIQIVHRATFNPTPYQNSQVILSGVYSACTHTMTLDANQNIKEF